MNLCFSLNMYSWGSSIKTAFNISAQIWRIWPIRSIFELTSFVWYFWNVLFKKNLKRCPEVCFVLVGKYTYRREDWWGTPKKDQMDLRVLSQIWSHISHTQCHGVFCLFLFTFSFLCLWTFVIMKVVIWKRHLFLQI